MSKQSRALAIEDDSAIFKHITVIGDTQRDGGILLDDNNGNAELVPDLHQPRH